MDIKEIYIVPDNLIKEVLRYLVDLDKPFAISDIQHHFQIGYNRTIGIFGYLEKENIISGYSCCEYKLDITKEEAEKIIDKIECLD